MMPEPSPPPETVDTPEHCWTDLVNRIRNEDPSGMEELYDIFSRGVRFFLYRQIGQQELDDRLHEVFLVVAQAIRRGELREPVRLMGYVRTVVRRQIAAEIERVSLSRRRHAEWDAVAAVPDGNDDPEQAAIQKENQEFAYQALRSISPRDREILMRFYLHHQTPERICREMQLTETQFRLLKSRAKARFGQTGKRQIRKRLRFW